MFNNSIKILYFILISLFLYLILSTYFSKDNIIKNSDISKKLNIILSDKPKDLKPEPTYPTPDMPKRLSPGTPTGPKAKQQQPQPQQINIIQI